MADETYNAGEMRLFAAMTAGRMHAMHEEDEARANVVEFEKLWKQFCTGRNVRPIGNTSRWSVGIRPCPKYVFDRCELFRRHLCKSMPNFSFAAWPCMRGSDRCIYVEVTPKSTVPSELPLIPVKPQ